MFMPTGWTCTYNCDGVNYITLLPYVRGLLYGHSRERRVKEECMLLMVINIMPEYPKPGNMWVGS